MCAIKCMELQVFISQMSKLSSIYSSVYGSRRVGIRVYGSVRGGVFNTILSTILGTPYSSVSFQDCARPNHPQSCCKKRGCFIFDLLDYL